MFDINPETIADFVLRDWAGDAVFNRGKKYYLDGHAQIDILDNHYVKLTVRGTSNYTVYLELDLDNGQIYVACNCPQSAQGAFCKHMVAACICFRDEHLEPNRQSPWKRTLRLE